MLYQLFFTVLLLIGFSKPALAGNYELVEEAKEIANSEIQSVSLLKYAKGNIKKVERCLAQGANPNAREHQGLRWTPLITAAFYGQLAICKLLIKHGAYVNTKDQAGFTALMYTSNNAVYTLLIEEGADISLKSPRHGTTSLMWVAQHALLTSLLKKRYKLIITRATFNPVITTPELRAANKRTFTRLCVLKRMCPTLPRELRRTILASDRELFIDAWNSAFFIHTRRYDRVPFLPIQTVRALVQNNLLDADRTVAIVKAERYKRLTPLMLEAIPTVKRRQTDCLDLLNPDKLEQNFGPAIEQNIKKQLGIRAPGCQVQ